MNLYFVSASGDMDEINNLIIAARDPEHALMLAWKYESEDSSPKQWTTKEIGKSNQDEESVIIYFYGGHPCS